MLHQLDTVIGFVIVISVVSLLIMIVTQMASSLLGLRGKNLADALQTLFLHIDPDLVRSDLDALIHNALTSPLISDSILSVEKKGNWLWQKARARWMLASAIRPDELLEHLKKEAGCLVAQTAQVPGSAPRQPGLPPAAATDAAKNVFNLMSPAQETAAFQSLPAEASVTAMTVGAGAAAQRILSALRAQPGGTNAVPQFRFVGGVAPAVPNELARLEKWFNSAQDRATQWFSMHTRMLTILFSVIAAFALQLDTIALLQRLSADPDLRAKLIARADAVERQEDNVAGQEFDPGMHKQIMGDLRKKYPEIPAALDSLPSRVSSLGEAEHWLEDNLKNDSANLPAILDGYHQMALVLALGQSHQTFKECVSGFNETGLQLIPDPYPPMPGCFWPLRHLVGILVSAAFLSLGSPFWFNLLKQLVNLRPALANAVDNKPKQDSPNPAASN